MTALPIGWCSRAARSPPSVTIPWQRANLWSLRTHNSAPSGGAGLRRVRVWKCVDPVKHVYVVTYQGGKFVDTLTLRDGDGILDGNNNFRTHVTARRMPEAGANPPPVIAQSPGAGQPKANPAKPGTDATPGVEYMGMKLAGDWMPKRETNALELTRNLSMFCTAAVQGRETGNDIMPRPSLQISHG